jgi:hypothetical protein
VFSPPRSFKPASNNDPAPVAVSASLWLQLGANGMIGVGADPVSMKYMNQGVTEKFSSLAANDTVLAVLGTAGGLYATKVGVLFVL